MPLLLIITVSLIITMLLIKKDESYKTKGLAGILLFFVLYFLYIFAINSLSILNLYANFDVYKFYILFLIIYNVYIIYVLYALHYRNKNYYKIVIILLLFGIGFALLYPLDSISVNFSADLQRQMDVNEEFINEFRASKKHGMVLSKIILLIACSLYFKKSKRVKLTFE